RLAVPWRLPQYQRFQDLSQHRNRGFYIGLSMVLDGNIATSANTSRQNGVSSHNVGAQRTADFGGGFGWGVQSGMSGSSSYRQAQVEYLGNYGRVTARAQSDAMSNAASLGASGALVLMDGHMEAARQVGSGFALVSTPRCSVASSSVPALPGLEPAPQPGLLYRPEHGA
ncbi:fimbria/pilus outer membrane usher protein, partial [Corynebacterium diphtheriae]